MRTEAEVGARLDALVVIAQTETLPRYRRDSAVAAELALRWVLGEIDPFAPDPPAIAIATPEPDIKWPDFCPECLDTKLTWALGVRTLDGPVEGRLRTHDVHPILVLSCETCSETVVVVNDSATITGVTVRPS